MRFVDLLQYSAYRHLGPAGAAEAQRAARKRFPEAVLQNGLSLGDSLGPPPGVERYVALGVSPAYAVLDLELLDEFAPALAGCDRELVELFDIDHYLLEFEALFPHSAGLARTPIVIVFEHSRIVESVAGGPALQALRTRYL